MHLGYSSSPLYFDLFQRVVGSFPRGKLVRSASGGPLALHHQERQSPPILCTPLWTYHPNSSPIAAKQGGPTSPTPSSPATSPSPPSPTRRRSPMSSPPFPLPRRDAPKSGKPYARSDQVPYKGSRGGVLLPGKVRALCPGRRGSVGGAWCYGGVELVDCNSMGWEERGNGVADRVEAASCGARRARGDAGRRP